MHPFHMSAAQFRNEGKKLVDWIADYYEHVEKFPVLAQVNPGDVLRQLPDEAPEEGESFAQMMHDVDQIIMPGITHWQSPSFFAYFPANTSFPSILGEMLSAGLGVQGMIWATSPSATELEIRMMDWLVKMMGLPEKFLSGSSGGGVIQDTASSAVLSALLAAREQATQHAVNEKGVVQRMAAYVSSHAHSSLEKAIKIAGIGRENIRIVEVDEHFAMRPEHLRKQIQEDRSMGYLPFFVCATMGTTSSNAMDPIDAIGDICRQENCWLHVDAAMSGSALLCPEFRYLAKGLELADSFAFNPHKWMFTNFDCDCFWVADRQNLINTFSILPEYLRNKATDSGSVTDYRDWHIQLGRRFRSLKLWFVIRHYGINGLQHHIREHVALAHDFAEWVDHSPHFELVVAPPLNLVVFRFIGSDDHNMQLMNNINQTGKVYFTHTRLNGRIVLRLSIGQTHTTTKHVQMVKDLLIQFSNSQDFK